MFTLSTELYSLGNNIDLKIKADTNTSIFYKIRYESDSAVLAYVRGHIFLLDSYDLNKRNLLHYAVLYKKYKLLKFLISQKKSVSSQDGAGDTPLHLAVKNSDIYAIKLLMLSPSFIIAMKLKNRDNLTPVEIANINNNNDIIELFNSYMSEDNQEWIDYDDFDKDLENHMEKQRDFFEKLQKKSNNYKETYIKAYNKVKSSKNLGNINIELGERK